MKNTQNMIKLIALMVIATIALVWFSASTDASNNAHRKTYEIRQNISVPAKQSDTITVVNSYEKLMHLYISLSENNMVEMEKNSDVVISKLDSIEKKIDDLGARLERIEQALSTPKDLPEPRAPEIPEPEIPEMPKVPEPEIPQV